MDRNQLKKLLKPLIKECIKESLFEDGMLTKIVSECVQGLDSRALIIESNNIVQREAATKQPQQSKPKAPSQEVIKAKQEFEESTKQLLKKATGFDKVFENVQPLEEAPKTIKEAQEQIQQGHHPVGAGYNINGLLEQIGGKDTWKRIDQALKNNLDKSRTDKLNGILRKQRETE